MKKSVLASVIAVLVLGGSAHAAAPSSEEIRAAVESKVRSWVGDATVVDSIKAQNTRTASLGQADIDNLDKQWRAETGAASKPLIDETLGNPLSAFLKKVKSESGGLYTEIFVMDGKGLNVGQSDVTSDYWQGDEAKWQKSYLAGADAVHVGEVEFDESSQTYQSQVSLTIVDPATSSVIGAVTIGVDVAVMGQ